MKNTRVRHTNINKYLTRKFPDNFPAMCSTSTKIYLILVMLSSHADNIEEMSRVVFFFVENVNTTYTNKEEIFSETLRLQFMWLCMCERKFSFILHRIMREWERKREWKIKKFHIIKSLIESQSNINLISWLLMRFD